MIDETNGSIVNIEKTGSVGGISQVNDRSQQQSLGGIIKNEKLSMLDNFDE